MTVFTNLFSCSRLNYEKVEEIEVKATLDVRLAQKFLEIKMRYHLKSNADTVRFCIGQQYEREIKSKQNNK